MVGKRTSLFVTATTALAALSLGAGAAAAADPPGGRILLESRQGSVSGSRWDWNIFSARPDGSDLRPVLTSSASESNARFSPDGTKIVYERAPVYYRDGGAVDMLGVSAIYVANADGSSPTPIVEIDGFNIGRPDWSPDGSRIAFDLTQESSSTAAVYSVSIAGGYPTLLSSGAINRYDGKPVWSPDSRRIALVRYAPPFGVSTIPVGLQGAGERIITSHPESGESSIDWSRANGLLAYVNGNKIFAGRDSESPNFSSIVTASGSADRVVWTPDGGGTAFQTDLGPRWQALDGAPSVGLLEQIPTLGRPNYRLEDWVADPPADYPAGTDPQVPANGVDPRAAQPLTSAPKPIRPTSAKTVRCTAPRLTKQSLKQAKARARKAKCPVKIVRKRIRGKKFGIVTSQSPKANSKIFNGQKLKLVVAKR